MADLPAPGGDDVGTIRHGSAPRGSVGVQRRSPSSTVGPTLKIEMNAGDIPFAASVALERLAEARGVRLERVGQILVGVCPFHEGAERMLTIDPAVNTWSCTTCAPSSLSVVEWVMKAEGVSKKHAVELLKSDFTASAPSPKRGRQKGVVPIHATTRKLDAPFGADEPDEVLLRRVVGFYNETLKTSPEAVVFLQKRGVTNGEVIERFMLGYANRTLAYRLPAKSRKVGADLRGRLQHLGVLRESGHERMRGSVVIPLFDAEGRITNIYGRKVTPNLRPGTELHMWLDSTRSGLFNRGAFESSKTMIIAGSILDALALWSNGQRNVTAIHGLDGPADDIIAAIESFRTERILLAFRRSNDADDSAAKIGEKLAGLAGLGVEVLRVTFPAGMDAIDFITSVPSPPEAVAHAVRSAVWMSGKAPTSTAAISPRVTASASSTTSTSADTVIGIAPDDIAPDRKEAPEASASPSARSPTTDSSVASTRQQATPDRKTADEVVLIFDDRRWRIRGLARTTPETMKVNVMVSKDGAAFHVDVVELYSARQRATFTKMAADELALDETLLKTDLGHVLLRLEEAQDELLRRQDAPDTTKVEMTDEDRLVALALLRDPRLLDRILEDFERVGVVGEQTNLLLGYVASISRKLERPLAVVIQSSSAAGKSSLMDAVLDFVPEEDRMSFSAMTGQSLYYMGGASLRNKVLSVAEEAGAERASYALKLLQSEGALTIASTGKDPGTGRLVSQEYRVEGPVAIMMTTTAIDVDEELLSRCIVLSVDEGPEQTKAIHEKQRAAMSLEGRLRRHERARLLRLHQNVQRLVRPLLAVNPFASEMAYSDHRVRARRDHRKLLVLIEAIALLHQHQRDAKTIEHGGHVVEYIEVAKTDIEIATKLMNAIDGPRTNDLPPQTRTLLTLLDRFVKERSKTVLRKHVRFTRREIREALGLGDTQAKVHLRRLVESEYVIAHAAPHGRGVVYELAFEGDDVHAYDAERSDLEDDKAGCERGSVGPRSGEGRPLSDNTITRERGSDRVEASADSKAARLGNEDADPRGVRISHEIE